MAREQGLDTAILRGIAEHGGDDQVVALTPNRVRSFYAPDQLLYSGGPSGAGVGAAALASRPDAQATPSQGTSPMSAGPAPFGFGLTPEDLARLMQRQGATDPRADMPADGASPVSFLTQHGPDGFVIPPGVRAMAPAGDPSALRPGDVAPAPAASMPPSLAGLGDAPAGFGLPAPAPQGVTGLPPSFSFPDPIAPRVAAPVGRVAVRAPTAEADDTPAPATVPLPPSRPLGLGAPSQADMPAVGAVPAQGQAAPIAEKEGPGFGAILGKLGDAGIGDQMMAFGSGLMTKRGIGPGIAAGFDGMQRATKDRAVTDLARAEFGLKTRKAAQETGALAGNAAIIKRAFPTLSDAEAQAQGANGATVTEALKILRDPNHGRENDPEIIKARAQAQAEGSAAGSKDDVQLVTRPDGSIVGVNKSKLGETAEAGSPGAVTTVVPGSEEDAKMALRRQAVIQQGHDPKDGRYADYILSGTLPKENQQLLTSSDKKAIMEGEDTVLAHRNTLQQLGRALDLSKKAYDGAGASQRAMFTSNVPEFLGGHSPESLATRELDNVVTGQALDNLKATFGGAPTEGERAILLQVQGSANMPQALREQVFRNAMAKVQQKMDFEQQRVDQLRGGSYYKQGGGGQPAQAAPAPQDAAAPQDGASPGRIVQFRNQDEYAAAPSGTRFVAPDGKLRVKP